MASIQSRSAASAAAATVANAFASFLVRWLSESLLCLLPGVEGQRSAACVTIEMEKEANW